jgi:predicted SAM-dependent methyltransferase
VHTASGSPLAPSDDDRVVRISLDFRAMSGSPVVKLNVGCGKTVASGWINIDKSPSVMLSAFPRLRRALFASRILTAQQAEGFPSGVIHADVAKRIPLEDGSADFVYSSHMIEHLSRWEGLRFVKECRRVLKTGGLLRLATPDLATMVSDYLNGTSPFSGETRTPADAFCFEYRAYSNIDSNAIKSLIHKLVSGDTHQWIYDHTSIAELLREGGLTAVAPCAFQLGRTPDLASVEHRERGLFVEAQAG